MDCDAFYASVEKRDNPELASKPVIIGGGRRGVVSTACYVARVRGVKSAMPMFQALKLCPEAVVVRPRMEEYVKASAAIRKMMQELTPAIEPLSLDEALNLLENQSYVQRNGDVFEFLTDDEKAVFKTSMEIDQRWVIELASDRQQYIDQAQSLNLFFRPDVNLKYLHACHFLAWKKGLKTGMYYLRTKPAVNAIQFTVDTQAAQKSNA